MINRHHVRVGFKPLLRPMLVLVVAGLVSLVCRGVEAQVSQGGELHDLEQQRLATLGKLVDVSTEGFKKGQVSADELQSAVRAKEEAELALCTSSQERVAILQKALADAKLREAQVAKLAAMHLAPETSLLKVTAERLRQEILFEQAKGK